MLYFGLAAYKPVWAWYCRVYIQPERVTQVPASSHTASRRKEPMHHHVTCLQFQPKFWICGGVWTLSIFKLLRISFVKFYVQQKFIRSFTYSHHNRSFLSYVMWFGVHNCTATLGHSMESQESIVLLSELWKTFFLVYWREEAAHEMCSTGFG